MQPLPAMGAWFHRDLAASALLVRSGRAYRSEVGVREGLHRLRSQASVPTVCAVALCPLRLGRAGALVAQTVGL